MFDWHDPASRHRKKYFDTYYKNVEDYIVSVDGVLSRKKNTEYSRVILALTAIGKNPADAAGFNLLLPLGDFDENGAAGRQRRDLCAAGAGQRRL